VVALKDPAFDKMWDDVAVEVDETKRNALYEQIQLSIMDNERGIHPWFYDTYLAMTTYLHARLLAVVPVVLGVSVLGFASLYSLPGDPIQALVGDVPPEKERVEALRQELALNDPAWVQYLRFLGNALHGDLGRSL
jgi:Binding-prot-dependent transport system membrane comp, N-term